MPCGMKNPRSLKVVLYASHLTYLKKCLSFFSGSKISDKICVMDLNDFFYSMPNNWSKQANAQGFYYE